MPLKRFPTDSSSEAALIALNNKENHIKKMSDSIHGKRKRAYLESGKHLRGTLM